METKYLKYSICFLVICLLYACNTDNNGGHFNIASEEGRNIGRARLDSINQAEAAFIEHFDDTYLGYWKATGSDEVLKLYKNKNWNDYRISDGNKEFIVYYDGEINSFTRHQNDKDMFFEFDETNKNMSYKVLEFGADEKQLIRTFQFLKK